MKKITILIAIFGLLITKVDAQSDIDALRFSQTPVLGSTARSLALGGASGALGADQSAVLSNPAGLGQYKTNVFNVSLGTNSLKNKSSYLSGSARTSNLFSPQFTGINLVFTDRRMRGGNPEKKGWVNTNFQLGYNKIASFDKNISYTGSNTQNSFTDYVANYVQGTSATDLDANDEQLSQGFYYFDNMFWYSYLIDSSSNRNYFANYDPANGPVSQSGKVITRGGMGEYNFAFAANFEHKVYFGGGLNITQVNYTETNTFSEIDNPLTIGNWRSFDFKRNLETKGYGVNGRLGVIFRPNNNIRIGGTLHTPTKLVLTDNYNDELYVVQDDGAVDDLSTIEKEFEYNITTPAKYGLQAAYIFGKQGLISAELESIDYSTMNLSSTDELFEASNDNIANKYRSTLNLKVGGEYVINSFRLRGGFASIGNPLAEGSEYSRKIISGGFGMHEQNWAFDFGMSRDMTNDVYVPYSIAGMPSNGVNNKLTNTRLMITLTTKF